jgi:hypothetical protein
MKKDEIVGSMPGRNEKHIQNCSRKTSREETTLETWRNRIKLK